MRAAPRLPRVAIPIVALLAAGSLFGQDPCCIPVDLSGGGWKGHWESCTTGHHGPLKARFKKVDDCHYRVTFSGRFRKVIPFRYAMTMTVVGPRVGSLNSSSPFSSVVPVKTRPPAS